MNAKRSIPLDREDEIMRKWEVENPTLVELTMWVRNALGIKTSKATVGRLIRNKRDEKNLIARKAYSEAAAKFAVSDMELINEGVYMLSTLRQEAFEKKEVADVSRLSKDIKDHVQLRISLSGTDNNEVLDADDLEDDLLSLSERLELDFIAKQAN